MIRFGAKRKQHKEKMQQTHGTPCHVCGAVGSEPCISKVDGHTLKNHHVGRKK